MLGQKFLGLLLWMIKLLLFIASSSKSESQVSTRFLILTTGDQLKLYPFIPDIHDHHHVKSSSPRQQQQPPLTLSEQYYLIKPLPFNLSNSIQQQELVDQYGNNSFTRYYLYKALKSLHNITKSSPLRKQSILPKSYDTDAINEDDDTANHGWMRPWIVDVDYFFDASFCPTLDLNQPQINKCLVIVWLDKSNKYVRYGSLDLRRNPIGKLLGSRTHSTPTTISKSKVLWLMEYPPIDLNQYDPFKNRKHELEVYAMTIDKQRSRIYISFSDGSRKYANKLLTGKLTSIPEDRVHNQLSEVDILRINECLDGLPESSVANTTFRNFHVDEESGEWLFFFDQHGGGKIFALQAHQTGWSETEDESSHPSTLQALVRDISLDPEQRQRFIDDNMILNINATGMAMDPIKRRIYWLNEASELYSSNYAGLNVHIIGKLSQKPAIRSVRSMQVFQDTLYISDPIKRSLIAYKLPKDQKAVQDSDREVVVIDNKQQLLDIHPTHQVLLVEASAFYGFKLFDTISLTPLTSELDIERSRFGHKLASFIGRRGKTVEESEYSLLIVRVNDSSQCGYGSNGKDTYKLDYRIFFICEVAAVQIAFSLSCLFCWYKKKSKLLNKMSHF